MNEPIVHSCHAECPCQPAWREVERLRNVIGKLYVQRGLEANELRNAIRRAFRESKEAS